jgi:hypothetical protein
MSADVMMPGTARCPAPSVQEVIRTDGDTDRQPGSYKLDAYKFLGDQDIPFERYTSPEFFNREMERMWPRTWQWACREEHIPNPGDYYVYDVRNLGQLPREPHPAYSPNARQVSCMSSSAYVSVGARF